MTEAEIFGLPVPHYCYARIFFRKRRHPGANNCDCPKMDGGATCVPKQMRDAWFAYIRLSHHMAEV